MTRAVHLLACALLATLAGCERDLRNMYAQPRLGPDAGSPLFPDGKATRPPPPDSVAYAMGTLAKTSGGRRGGAELAAREAAERASAAPPFTRARLERGRARYDIACAPCHGAQGDGDGMVVRRGFPAPPSLLDARARAMTDRHVVDVVAQGRGAMPSLGDRVTPEDRWAIAGYVRALQAARPADAAASTAVRLVPSAAASAAEAS
jgi:mono/diheme cytochrome c family protein